MRRLLSIALILVLGLPLFGQALSSALDAQGSGARLPICCRRGGVHHCMEMAGVYAGSNGEPTLRATCPAFPRTTAQAHTGVWSFDGAGTASAWIAVHPAAVGQVEAGYRISFGRARHKRGPPSLNS